jgi:hypothetical protein
MKATSCPKKSVSIHQTTRCYVSEGNNLFQLIPFRLSSFWILFFEFFWVLFAVLTHTTYFQYCMQAQSVSLLWTTHKILLSSSVKVKAIRTRNYWGSSVWISTYSIIYWWYILLLSKTGEKMGYSGVVCRLHTKLKKIYESFRREVLYNILVEFGTHESNCFIGTCNKVPWRKFVRSSEKLLFSS